VDVGYDMSSFIEQLPQLLTGLRTGQETKVDLYPQGLERILTFRPSGERVMIQCLSRTDWIPDPEVESIAATELIAMLSRLAHDFATGLRAIDSELSHVEPFVHWLNGRV
jgi:hypothetical protein